MLTNRAKPKGSGFHHIFILFGEAGHFSHDLFKFIVFFKGCLLVSLSLSLSSIYTLYTKDTFISLVFACVFMGTALMAIAHTVTHKSHRFHVYVCC